MSVGLDFGNIGPGRGGFGSVGLDIETIGLGRGG